MSKIDIQDAKWISQIKWRKPRKGRESYQDLRIDLTLADLVICSEVRENVLSLLEAIRRHRSNGIVDHANSDPSDNRRYNLRYATSRQNACNRRKSKIWMGKKLSSKFLGVSFNKICKKWMGNVRDSNGRQISKYFDNEVSAARWRDAEAAKLYGEFAKLNFPKEETTNAGNYS